MSAQFLCINAAKHICSHIDTSLTVRIPSPTSTGTSTTTVINTFAKASYRSAKYFISITDATNTRYEIVEANVTHDGSDAYISTFGSTTNYTGGLAVFSAGINGSNVEVKVTNISADSCVFKFQRTAIDV